MLVSNAVHIWRESDGDYHIEWRASHPDTQVTVEPVIASSAAQAHYDVDTERARVSGLTPANRHFFRVRDQHGTEVLAAERKLGMQGTPNFRDFGGYRAVDGRLVKWGFLFRSGQLSNLSDQDVALLATLELDLVCDFRRLEEQEADPSRLPVSNPPRIASLPISPGSNAQFFEQLGGEFGDRQAMFDFMVEINRDFVEAPKRDIRPNVPRDTGCGGRAIFGALCRRQGSYRLCRSDHSPGAGGVAGSRDARLHAYPALF